MRRDGKRKNRKKKYVFYRVGVKGGRSYLGTKIITRNRLGAMGTSGYHLSWEGRRLPSYKKRKGRRGGRLKRTCSKFHLPGETGRFVHKRG